MVAISGEKCTLNFHRKVLRKSRVYLGKYLGWKEEVMMGIFFHMGVLVRLLASDMMAKSVMFEVWTISHYATSPPICVLGTYYVVGRGSNNRAGMHIQFKRGQLLKGQKESSGGKGAAPLYCSRN